MIQQQLFCYYKMQRKVDVVLSPAQLRYKYLIQQAKASLSLYESTEILIINC